MRIKKFIYNSYFGFNLSQLKLFRVWYGGTWYKITPIMFPYMNFWQIEIPLKHEKITDIEYYK